MRLKRLVILGIAVVFTAGVGAAHGQKTGDAAIPAGIIAAAVPRCEAALKGERVIDLPAPSVLTLYRSEETQWARSAALQLSSLEARSAAEVNTLVCVRASRISAGSYELTPGVAGGPGAFRIVWDVEMVRAADGAVVAGKRFYGTDPPERIRGVLPGEGDPPSTAEVNAWVRSRLLAMTLPVSKLQVQLPPGATWSVTPLDDRDRLENSLGMTATVYVQKTPTRPDCSSTMRRIAASGGKLAQSDYREPSWYVFALETERNGSVCGEFRDRMAHVIVGPLDVVKKSRENSEIVRQLLRGVADAIRRQLREPA